MNTTKPKYNGVTVAVIGGILAFALSGVCSELARWALIVAQNTGAILP